MHAPRVLQLQAVLREARDSAPLGLAKRSSNLFRDRAEAPKRRLDLGGFNHVLEVDAEQQWVDVEGSTTYEELVDATLPSGVMPAVVPQLKTITVGGAAAGVGIEASSFREGLVQNGRAVKRASPCRAERASSLSATSRRDRSGR